MQERVDQGAAIAIGVGGSGAGVDHHAGGFVDYGDVVVFIDNVEWNVFGYGAEGRAFNGAEDFNLFSSAEVERRLGRFSIHQDFFLRDKLLDAGAAGFGEVRDQELVETLAGVLGGDGEDFILGCHSERSSAIPLEPSCGVEEPLLACSKMNLEGNCTTGLVHAGD